MYDNGNCISIPATTYHSTSCSSILNKVTYKAGCATGTVNGESYSMSLMNGGISVLRFQHYTQDAISINGNNGADGNGHVTNGRYAVKGWNGFWKVVWNAGNDPGINHLWITNAPSALHSFSSNTDLDWDQLSDVNGYEVMYLMWATVAGTRTSNSAMIELVQAVVGK